MSRIMLAFMLIGLTSGCATAVEGEPKAVGAVDPSNYYGFELSAEEQQRLLLNQAVRQIEPCGLVDEAAIAQQGQVVAFGPGDTVGDCEIRYLPPGRDPDNSVWVTVDLASPVVLGPQAGDADGAPLYESSSGGGSDYCYRYLALDIELPDVESGNSEVTVKPPVAYAYISVYSAEGPPCEAVAAIARMVVANLRSGPPQRDADTPIPLATVDPCALVGNLPADFSATKVRFDDGPFKCNIELGDDRRLAITYQLSPDLDLPDERRVEWADGVFVVDDSSGCFAQFEPGTRVTTVADDPHVVQVLFQTFTCDTVEDLADSIAATYGV